MKNTTKKLLLALNPSSEMPFLKLSLSAVELLLPELSQEGRRSLLYLMQRKKLIQMIKLKEETYLTSTPGASKSIKSLFPALNLLSLSEELVRTVIVFKTAPKGDPQFRYLRNKVIIEGGMQLSRGVYLISGQLNASLVSTLETLYAGCIFLFTIDSWLMGTEQPIIDEYSGLSELITSYSSISNEIDRLLVNFDHQKGLNDKFKSELSKIYVRWFDTFSVDTGISALHFPNQPSGRGLLMKLQTLFVSV